MIGINNTQIFNSSSKSIRDFEEENAIKIQKVWRGFSQRDSYPCAFFGEMIRCDARLPLPFRPAYSDLCKESTLSVMEKAKGGKTTVYLPTTLPIVIKECGREKAIDRLYKMIVVRSFSRPFSNIVVPKAALHGKFMIEERLPINIDRYHNVRTYLDNLPLFDQAIKDMVYLFFKVYISGLMTHRLTSAGKYYVSGIRYDNIPLYLEEGAEGKVGKIGLVDLERITDPKERPDTHKMTTLAIMFPYHADIIMDESLNYCSFEDDEYEREICSVDEDEIYRCAEYGKQIMNKIVAAQEQSEASSAAIDTNSLS